VLTSCAWCQQNEKVRWREPGKCLSTPGVCTSVRPLSSMYSPKSAMVDTWLSPMSRQRATIAKRFLAFATSMRSFTSMDSRMHSECRSLDKLLSTFVTFIRSTQSQNIGQKTLSHRNPECIRSEEIRVNQRTIAGKYHDVLNLNDAQRPSCRCCTRNLALLEW